MKRLVPRRSARLTMQAGALLLCGAWATMGSVTPVAAESPDPTGRLALAVENDGNWDIVAYDLDSGESTLLADAAEADEWAPAHSHTGDRIAYLSDEADGTNQVWVMSVDGADARQVTALSGSGEVFHVGWTGDDRSLMVSVNTNPGAQSDQYAELLLVPANGERVAEGQPFISMPSWWASAAQGTAGHIAYATGTETSQDIAVIAAVGASPNFVAATDQAEDVPSISPDGAWVAFQVGSYGGRHIEIVRADGADRQTIFGSGGDDSDPVWSPDSQMLAFVAETKGQEAIWIVLLDGSATTTIDLPFSFDQIWYLSWGR